MSAGVTPDAAAVVALSDRLRPLLMTVKPDVAAAALSYELAAMMARERVPVALADLIVDEFALVMKRQIRTFGTGKEHP